MTRLGVWVVMVWSLVVMTGVSSAQLKGEPVYFPANPRVHASDCRTIIAYANEVCIQQQDNSVWQCRAPNNTNVDVLGINRCDNNPAAEWVQILSGGTGGTLQQVLQAGRTATDLNKASQGMTLGDGTARWRLFVSPEDGPTLLCEATPSGAACQRWRSRELFDWEFFPDGTFCTGPTNAIVNSTQIEGITCGTINASAALRTSQLHMPDDWDGGPIRVQVAWSDPDGASALAAGDIVAQCRGNGEAWGNNWSSVAAVDTTLATANALTWSPLTAAVTPAGTCSPRPRTLWLEWRMDAGNFAAAATNARFHGGRIWYQSVGEGLFP
jgi:hypothetical protein